LVEKQPNDAVKKRSPYRIPVQQSNKASLTPKQQRQRAWFLEAVGKFNLLPSSERSRWYASAPPISSFLWYYNWFMMNAIPNLWGVVPGGAGILKGIQNVKETIPITGAWATFPTAVDPSKCVFMLYGNAYSVFGGATDEYPFVIYPIYESVASGSVFITWPINPQTAAIITVSVIEYI